MAKKHVPEANEQQRVKTKYDRKMEARKQQKIKEERQEKVTKIGILVVAAALVCGIVISVAVSLVNRNNALNGTYMKVGEHELSQAEYDFYYQSAVNSYLTSYSSILPYMGLDTSVDFDQQEYAEGMTWKDMFDEMTVEQIRQNKAMLDDAQNTGFTYDTDEAYENFVSGLEQSAASAGQSLKDYYKSSFGPYATEKNMEPYIRESLLANAYYNHLLEENTPSEEEVKDYYEANTQTYDKVDYRSFIFNADLADDATEKEISVAMDELEKKANAMKQAREKGEDFEQLCLENAGEDEKANYEEEDTEYCLSQGKYYSGIASIMGDWLFEDGRTPGDLTVLRNDEAKTCYVVEFVNRYFDEADNEKISGTIAGQRVSDYIAGLVENYEVVDVKGQLKYLTIPAPAEEEGFTEEETSTE